ncbi:MAG: WYL domain-containing protein [Clostridia bacterium]
MADASQMQRQHFLLSILADRKSGFTANELLNYASRAGYDVSKRTISRDIDDLSSSFLIYETEEAKEVRYFLEDRLHGLVELNLDEMITLYYLKEMVDAHASSDLATSAKAFLSKLISNLSSDKSTFISKFKDAIRVEHEQGQSADQLDVSMLQKLRDAIAEQQTIEICYYALINDEMTTRKVDPYFLELSEGNYKIVGHCHLRGCLRAFNVSRIKTLKLEKASFKKPENFYEEYVKGRFDKLAADQKENLKFKLWGNAAKLVKEYESRRADKITSVEHGKIIFERKAAITDDVIMWVLSYGDEIEVLEPQALKDKVLEKARGIVAVYLPS